ncbi:hypothetical protein ILUMI_21209 [Ignelater luminosus]|uniref:Uncharacterized protein n=1 Tax=Ignelater luminosus TaxID=2038154 RepID=A0A8K0CI89_IGNLU|nr:hypothetical protein ILUMI_21209 [Ignelater luminosus]
MIVVLKTTNNSGTKIKNLQSSGISKFEEEGSSEMFSENSYLEYVPRTSGLDPSLGESLIRQIVSINLQKKAAKTKGGKWTEEKAVIATLEIFYVVSTVYHHLRLCEVQNSQELVSDWFPKRLRLRENVDALNTIAKEELDFLESLESPEFQLCRIPRLDVKINYEKENSGLFNNASILYVCTEVCLEQCWLAEPVGFPLGAPNGETGVVGICGKPQFTTDPVTSKPVESFETNLNVESPTGLTEEASAGKMTKPVPSGAKQLGKYQDAISGFDIADRNSLAAKRQHVHGSSSIKSANFLHRRLWPVCLHNRSGVIDSSWLARRLCGWATVSVQKIENSPPVTHICSRPGIRRYNNIKDCLVKYGFNEGLAVASCMSAPDMFALERPRRATSPCSTHTGPHRSRVAGIARTQPYPQTQQCQCQQPQTNPQLQPQPSSITTNTAAAGVHIPQVLVSSCTCRDLNSNTSEQPPQVSQVPINATPMLFVPFTVPNLAPPMTGTSLHTTSCSPSKHHAVGVFRHLDIDVVRLKENGIAEDVFRRLLAATDPYVASLRKPPQKKLKSLLSDKIDLLLQPKTRTDKNEVDEDEVVENEIDDDKHDLIWDSHDAMNTEEEAGNV